MPNLSLMTLARGARQFVVQEAFEIFKRVIDGIVKTDWNLRTTLCSGLYESRLTPTTYIGASAEGAEMTTFFAPPLRWAEALMELSEYDVTIR